MKKKLPQIRAISCWCVYNPTIKAVESFHKYKYQAAKFAKRGHCLVNLRGTYIVRAALGEEVR